MDRLVVATERDAAANERIAAAVEQQAAKPLNSSTSATPVVPAVQVDTATNLGPRGINSTTPGPEQLAVGNVRGPGVATAPAVHASVESRGGPPRVPRATGWRRGLHHRGRALIEVPIWRPGKTAKNWLAVIAIDPSQSGGLDRQFARKAKGDDYLYIVPDWHLGDAVEFGADGRNERCRWYGYVVRIGQDHVVLHKCLDGKAAVREGKVFATTIVAVADDAEVTA